MVHGILQFTPSIAFRYVLHRCESRDIRCRESFCVFTTKWARLRRTRTANGGATTDGHLFIPIPWRNSRRGLFVLPRGHGHHRPVIASNFLGLSGHSPSKKLATEDHLRVAS
ncbi:hypothetical protein V6N13_037234 [Hibiscus sabdariffa]